MVNNDDDDDDDDQVVNDDGDELWLTPERRIKAMHPTSVQVVQPFLGENNRLHLFYSRAWKT